jgi:hypothetical protein
MEINLIGTILIGLVILIASLLILKSMGYDIRIVFAEKIKETLSNLYSQIFGKGYYDLCGVYDNEYISFKDFEQILNAYYNGKCENTRISVILSSSFTRDDIRGIARDLEIAKNGDLVIFDYAEPIGGGFIIVEGNLSSSSRFILEAGDRIDVYSEGHPEKDVLIALTGTDCDPYEKVCIDLSLQVQLDEHGCPITRNKDTGEECDCNSNCRIGLKCYKESGNSRIDDGIIGHCCPLGETWDGGCGFKKSFNVLFLELDDGTGGGINNFDALARNTGNLWTQITPLLECSSNIDIITDGPCQVPDQQLVCDGDQRALRNTIENIVFCASEMGYESTYTRIVGVLPRQFVCTLPEGSVEGYANGYGSPVVVGLNDFEPVVCHELGHTFGLCDEAYGGGYCDESICSSGYCSPDGGGITCLAGPKCCPNKPQKNSIMCKSQEICNYECTYQIQFASLSYSHLSNELLGYCEII